MKSLIFCVLLGMTSLLTAEIESIQLDWNPKFCKKCLKEDLYKLFENMHGVEEFNLDESIGKVTLKWKKDVHFSFSSLNLGLRRVGPRVRSTKITVSGKMKHHHQSVTLISKGDETRFQLFSSQEARHAKDTNRWLTSSLRKRLIHAEEKEEIATIEGQLFPPNHLVIDEISYQPSKDRKGRQ